MCCIIHRPKDSKEIPKSNIDSIVRLNSDGWGISYIKDGNLKIVKSLSMSDALTKIRELEKENIEFLFHARYATHGDKIIENCHPFKLVNGALFHNGKIDITCKNTKLSDTHYFTQKVNKFLKKGRSLDWIVEQLKSKIGLSRLAFMAGNGAIAKFGEWHEVDGCYYSKINWQWGNYNSAWGEEYYAMWDTVQSKLPSKSTFESTPEELFQEAVENCRAGKMIYSYSAKRMNEKQLISLALNFPEACAQVLLKIQRPSII